MNITEDYVSFEIAKLLKEKGFMEGAIIKFFASGYDSKGNILDIRDTELKDYPRPTLQMAMKWLREVHNKHICSFPVVTDDDGIMGYWWEDCIITDRRYNSVKTGKLYNSPEEAYEAAIKYCLTNLIK